MNRNRALHFRSRAEEVRAMAQDMQHPECIGLLNKIADDYDRIAEFQEQLEEE
jgi:hypothetical protein